MPDSSVGPSETWIVKATIEGDYPVSYEFGPFADEESADAFRDDIEARYAPFPDRFLMAATDVLSVPDAANHLLGLRDTAPKPGPPQPPGVGKRRHA